MYPRSCCQTPQLPLPANQAHLLELLQQRGAAVVVGAAVDGRVQRLLREAGGKDWFGEMPPI